jgi:hypothetical protein
MAKWLINLRLTLFTPHNSGRPFQVTTIGGIWGYHQGNSYRQFAAQTTKVPRKLSSPPIPVNYQITNPVQNRSELCPIANDPRPKGRAPRFPNAVNRPICAHVSGDLSFCVSLSRLARRSRRRRAVSSTTGRGTSRDAESAECFAEARQVATGEKF